MDDLIRRASVDDREARGLLFDACYTRAVAAVQVHDGMQACDAEDLVGEAFGRLATGDRITDPAGPDALVDHLVADALSPRTR